MMKIQSLTTEKYLEQYILEGYKNASNSQDSMQYASLFHDDAIWCPPSIPDYSGRTSIAYGYDAKQGNINVETFVKEVIVADDVGLVIGGATIEFYSFDQTVNKKFWHRVFWFFKNKDNCWKIYRQIWNVKKTIELPKPDPSFSFASVNS